MLDVLKFLLWFVPLLFVLSLFVYFFNLDMKTMTIVEPILNRHYDRIKRDRKI
jgi:hypothetical protein